jgi:phage terminase large subunit GpA-like protein
MTSHVQADLARVIRNSALPERIRTMQDFAEREIRLATGPKKGLRYRADYMPFMIDVLAEFDRGRYTMFFGAGPAQAGKTLHFCLIPCEYHMFEVVEDVILGAPIMEMAKAAWKERILPAIEETRYREFLPRHGGGGRGGVPDSIRLRNGAGLRFMGGGGKDSQRSSHTARVVIATELDKLASAGLSGSEADPITQLMARTKSFGSAARFYGECTMTTTNGRIYREVVKLGTDSRVVLRCPRCLRWIWPERGGLVGWQEATDELEAQTNARFQCPRAECRGLWTEDDRRAALRIPRIVARGQDVRGDGVLEGELPRTKSFGFRWNAMASPFTSIPELAAREWKAAQATDEREERGIIQFDWAEPWESKGEDLVRPDVAMVLQKIHPVVPRKVIPPDTVRLTLGVDVGSWVVWYVIMAWFKDGTGHVVDWDGVTVNNPDGIRNPVHILAALRDLRDKVIKPGWGSRGPEHPDGEAPGRQPDKIIVDSGYEQDLVYLFVRESGEPRFLASKGFGSNKGSMWTSLPAAKPTPNKLVDQEIKMLLQPAGVHLIAIHADYWKARIHDGLHAASGAPGSITIPAGSPKDRELRYLARQLVAEERQTKSVAGREPQIVWVRLHTQNHFLDCASMAAVGAYIEGVRVALPAPMPVRPMPSGRPTDAQLDPSRIRKIRSKY